MTYALLFIFSFFTLISSNTSIENHPLQLPEVRKKAIIETCCTEVFIKNNLSQLNNLTRSIAQSPRSLRNDLYASIITWSLKNNYTHCDTFVEKIPTAVLARAYLSYSSLGLYLLLYALQHHHNHVVKVLLPRLSVDFLTQKDLIGKTCQDYALDFNNKEAKDLIAAYIDSQATYTTVRHVASNITSSVLTIVKYFLPLVGLIVIGAMTMPKGLYF